MNNIKSILYLLIFINLILVTKSNVVWEIDKCRITTQSNGSFLSCQEQVDCANQTTGSRIECSVYTYTSITKIQTCISTCCSYLDPVPTNLTGPKIQQCYDKYQLSKTLFIVKIVLGVFGSIAIIVGGISIYLFAFVRNPYTAKRVYVGCCCCKKIADFEKDRLQLGKSTGKLGQPAKKDPIAQHQIKINKIQIT